MMKEKWNSILAWIRAREWYEVGILLFIMAILFATPFIRSWYIFHHIGVEISENGSYKINVGALPQDEPVVKISFENIPESSFVPIKEGKMVRINLASMQLTRYENGSPVGIYPIIAKGKKGSIWETPGGLFEVDTKEEDYYSEKVGAWLPYSLHLFGNYFIHGTPHDKNGRSLPLSFQNGAIRLSTENAEELFNWVDFDTKISIFSDSTLKPEAISTDSVYIAPDGTARPNVSADAYIVSDIDTGEIILQKYIDAPYPIASVTKLMTAVTSVENENQFASATVSKEAAQTYGHSVFKPGEDVGIGTLLYPLLLPSSNVAAEILAEFYGRDAFLQKMNEKAQGLQMENTSFSDPSGLSPKNVSSARDLLALVRYITKEKPYLWDITKRTSYSAEGHTWTNVDKLVKDPERVGSKLGFTDEALQTYAGVWNLPLGELSNRHIGIVVLHSKDRFTDTENILRYLKKRVVYTRSGNFKVSVEDPKNEITMRFVGDIMLDRGVKFSVNKNFDGDFNHLFDLLGESYKDADIFFANLEGPVSDTGQDKHNLYSFRMDPRVLSVLKDAGLDMVSFANNHIGDWGKAAFDDTRARLDGAGIGYIGAAGNYADAVQPKIIEVKGVKIGFLGFTDVGPNSFAATDTESGVLLASDPHLDDIIKNAAEKVDFLVASFHWGIEYQKQTPEQIALAHRVIDDGAKLVVGHHPHVPQDVETYKGGLIVYSLGNFIFDQSFSKETMSGLTLEVTVDPETKFIKRYNTYTTTQNSLFQPEAPVKQ
jgi:D-alanyl-D-alanine carboxypeptidase